MAEGTVVFEIIASAKGVKVVQKQTDALARSSEKASKSTDKLSKSRDTYNRKEKGAAQISSNQTKNFSKMQQGIDGGGGSGGLVRAYALLAANVFALTAAFGVLSRSAQVDTLVESMEILSTTGGTYIKNLAREMQEASGFAVDLAQSFRQVSLASSAGLSTKEIEGLTEVARGAAISLGRNLPDAMDRIFRGAIKLEPEILDEIGLFVRVDDASKKYAMSLNKSAASLTQTEKRQAFLNEILEQGKKKFSEYAEEIKPDPYVRLGAALGDIAQGGLSILNSVLGPLLNFLAESQGALTAVFGVLVFSLLKKAIPALGQFNTKIAENAAQAAQNARDYTAGLKASTTAEVQETNRKLAEKGKLLEAERKLTGKGKGRAGQSAKAISANKILKTELDGEKRLAALRVKESELEKQILNSQQKQQKLLKQDLADMQVELRNLEAQERLTNKIAQNEARGRIDPKKGSLSQRRQQKLDQKETSTTILAGVSNKAEQQGVRAGFKELNTELKANKKNLNLGSKAMTAFSGTASILGSGISRLMMILGPWMMAFSILSPVIYKIIKAMGFMSEEAKTLDNSIKKVSDQTKNLAERFEAQVTQMNDQTRSFRERNKAFIAFNKNAAETLTNVVTLGKEFKEFESQLTRFGRRWEKIKSRFNLDRESKVIALQATSIKNVVKAALDDMMSGRIKNPQMFALMDEMLPMFDDAKVKASKLMSTTHILNKTIKEYGYSEEETQKILQKGIDLGGRFTAERVKYGVNQGKLTKQEGEYLKKLILNNNATTAYENSLGRVGKSMEDNVEFAEAGAKMYENMAKAAMAVESALEGASDNLNKFQASFRGKSNLDPAIASLRQLESSLEGLEKLSPESIKDFYENFDNTDNPFTLLFANTDRDADSFQTRLGEIKEDLLEIRDSQLLAQSEIKSATQLSKDIQDAYMGSVLDSNKIEEKNLFIKKKQHEIQQMTTKALLVSFGVTKEEAQVAAAAYRNAENDVERQKVLTALGIRDVDTLSFQAQFANELNAATTKKIAQAQEYTRSQVRQVEHSQKLLDKQKELAEIEQKRNEVQAKLDSLAQTGSIEVRPEETFRLEIEAAELKKKFAVDEANLKFTMLRLEFDLLIERRQVLEDEGKVAKGSTAAMRAGLKDNPLFNGAALKNAAKLAGEEFRLSVSQSISKGFGSGTLAGIRSVQAAEEKYRNDKAQAEKDARIKALQSGLTGMDVVTAGTDAGKKFDETQGGEDQFDLQMFRETASNMAKELAKLGPEGELVSSVVQGAFAVSDAWGNVGAVFSRTGDEAANSMERGAAVAEAVGTSLTAISGMMAANSKAQIAEIDGQIAAEKKRDGKSKESLAKIAAMDKKKEQLARKAFDQNKKMQMATTVANTAAAVMQLMANPADPTKLWASMMIPMTLALGAAQLAIISKAKFTGGSSDAGAAPKTNLSVGKRQNTVDVSRGSSAGELSYMRGERGVGSNANNFTPGGAMGRKGYAAGGEGILVGERGPEVVTPSQKVDVIPNDKLGGNTNVNFSINAVDASGVEDLLVNQRGNIIRMIREAANDTGERFLETVDTQAYGSNT